jgi:hypothetical protein
VPLRNALDIKLRGEPRTRDDNDEDNANGSRVDDRTKSLNVVNVGALRIYTNNPSSLVVSNTTIRVKLMAIDPFSSDGIGARRARDKRPTVVVDEGLVLVRHSSSPKRVLHSLAKGGRHQRDRCSDSR